jgi:hypothetical protein
MHPHVHHPDSIVAATLIPAALARVDPLLRRLLAGTQEFVKLADGRYRPHGCSLGLTMCFDASELVIHAR